MKLLSKETLDQMIRSKEDFLLIDVRESYEYDENNIGGVNIPLDEVLGRWKEIPSDKKVVMCCHTGKRSSAMAHTLGRKFDLNNIYTLDGGLSNYLGLE